MSRRWWWGVIAGTTAVVTLTASVAAASLRRDDSPAPPTDDAPAGLVFPTHSVGNRGIDVLALELLLAQHGFRVDPDASFDSADEAAVLAFQQANGLTADGVASSQTWTALTVMVPVGARGPAVRAVQGLLNRKRGAGLAVSGIGDEATREAVVAFQQYAGLRPDGVVGRATWQRLVSHFAYPHLTGFCDQDPDNNGAANWGTGSAIGQLEEAATRFAATGRGSLPLGDVGFEHGGPIPGHVTHQAGLDADVWPIRTDAAQCTAGRIAWWSPEYDRAANRELIQLIRAAAPGHVKLIYFNDPVLVAEGLVTPYPNHDDHLHVRYCERDHPDSAYAC